MKKGFTLLELMIAIAIVAVLAAVAAPVGKALVGRSRTINCSTNLRQIGVASMLYAGDNQMTLPLTVHKRGGKSWTRTLQPYASEALTSKCREDREVKRVHTYVINDFLTPNPAGAPALNFSILAKITRPEATFLFGEAAPFSGNTDHFHFAGYSGGPVPPQAFEAQVAVDVHDGSSNFLFVDGHVETMPWGEVKVRLAAPESRFVEPQ